MQLHKTQLYCELLLTRQYFESHHFVFDLLEGLVDGPEPADIRAGSEHEEPDDSQSKVGHTASTKHPSKAADEIHRKSSAIHCETKTDTLYFWCRCKKSRSIGYTYTDIHMQK